MYSIGEFSRITGLSIKTLRFYHEQNVLLPTSVDPSTGYRYYGPHLIETARVIVRLRELDFSLADITGILANHDDDADILDFLEQHRAAIQDKLRQYRQIATALDQIITQEREVRTTMSEENFEIQEKTLEPLLIAGVRFKGKYSDCGQGFSRIGRKFGRQICGTPLMLCYDSEYREDDADIEPCMPIRKGESVDGVIVRELPGGHAVTLQHRGPYTELGRSYARLLAFVKQHGWTIQSPTREIYLKGPGMIFKGNPKKYLTEIQILVDTQANASTLPVKE